MKNKFIYIFFSFYIYLFFSFQVDATFGYLDYSTYNIGDDIQSLAAERLLPKNAITIDREFIHPFQNDEIVHTLINGWFMQTKKTGFAYSVPAAPIKSWPPSPSINPLLTSVHFSPAFLPEAFSEEGIEFLKNHGPVGARDYWMLNELTKRNIPSYFSGCLTLTLENTSDHRDNIIYAVDLESQCIEFIRSKANCPVECISHIINENIRLNKNQRKEIAKKLLEKYKRARCVITSRLHAALPCLAFNTPVLLINTQPDQYRFEGLKELVHNCSQMEFLSGVMRFDFNHPPANKQDYIPLRENLIETVKQWVDKYQSVSKCLSPSLHILIATIGRASLFQMLKSLHSQLQSQDYLTVIFDARDDENIFKQVQEYLLDFPCNCLSIMEPVNRGYWGHGIRNIHNCLPGDFIMHADDDDIYAHDALDAIREHCMDKSTLYIFKMQQQDHSTLWVNEKITLGEIGTPMGVIPSSYNSQSTWAELYGGDFEFYNTLQKIVPNVQFVDKTIYLVRPSSSP